MSTIRDAPDSALAGNRFTVEAAVMKTHDATNTHNATITNLTHLVAGTHFDSASVTLEPAESQIRTLDYDTYPVTLDIEFLIEVTGTDSHDRRSVRIYAQILQSDRVDITGLRPPL